jgi:hypothetical protein
MPHPGPRVQGGGIGRAAIVRVVAKIEAKGRFERQPSAAGRAVFASAEPGGPWIDVTGWVAGDLPDALLDPAFDAQGAAPGRWQLHQAGEVAEIVAAGVTLIEPRPRLLNTLGAPFALKPAERRAARVLLALLRLPGGPRLLRAWHARRR